MRRNDFSMHGKPSSTTPDSRPTRHQDVWSHEQPRKGILCVGKSRWISTAKQDSSFLTDDTLVIERTVIGQWAKVSSRSGEMLYTVNRLNDVPFAVRKIIHKTREENLHFVQFISTNLG